MKTKAKALLVQKRAHSALRSCVGASYRGHHSTSRFLIDGISHVEFVYATAAVAFARSGFLRCVMKGFISRAIVSTIAGTTAFPN